MTSKFGVFLVTVTLHTGLLAQEAGTPRTDRADLVMEEVLVFGALSRFSALKADTPIMETARSISIVTEQQIVDRGALNLSDALNYSAGVTGGTFGFSTRGDFQLVRGLRPRQYQDSLQYLFGNYNNTRPNVYTMEQVEVLKGPASVLFGQGSPGGIVNVISKRPQETARHQAELEGGNNDRVQVAIDSTGAITGDGDWLYRMIGLYLDTDTQVDRVDEKTLVLAPSISWRPNDESDITLLLNYTDTESDTAQQFLPIAGTLYPAANGRKIDSKTYLGEPNFNRFDPTSTSVTLLASHQFNETWSMEFTSRYTDAETDYRQAWPSFIAGDRYVYDDNGELYKGGTVPRTWYGSKNGSETYAVDMRLRAEFDTGPIGHRALLGAQYQHVELEQRGFQLYALGYNPFTGGITDDTYWINVFEPVYGAIPPREVQDGAYLKLPTDKTEDTGLYASDQLSYQNWRLTLGLRYDDAEQDAGTAQQHDSEISSSVGLLYQFDNGVAPYASYSESFQVVVGSDGFGNALDPQKGEQLEIGIKYQPDHFPALVTLAWYDLRESNLPDPGSLPGQYGQQSGKAKIKGVELEGQAQFGEFILDLALTWIDAENPDGDWLASVPEEQASAWITWRPGGALRPFRAGAGIRYTGDSYDGSAEQRKTPGYTLGDLMLGYTLSDWDFAINVRNISDKSYYATCLARGDCFPGEERTLVGRVTYSF